MCSFVISNKNDDLEKYNFYSQKRGPDFTNYVSFKDFKIIHNLLSITGEFTKQPIFNSSKDIALIFNGEIYNYKSLGHFDSDGHAILKAYEEYGTDFVRYLDGEFALVIIDYLNSKIIMATDVFATKPIFYCVQDSSIGIASYKSCLTFMHHKRIKKIPANTLIEYDIKENNIKTERNYFEFNLKQYKNTFDDWFCAFDESIRKRCLTDKGIFLGLSSGHDSGAIACSLEKNNINFKAYSIAASENKNILDKREKIHKDKFQSIKISRKKYENTKKRNIKSCDDFVFENYNFKKDKASVGLSVICEHAKSDNLKICLSGQGADEIISDYALNGEPFSSQSGFLGIFPKELDSIFPYKNFYGGSQVKYLAKEEYVIGSHGIETRYPFLDVSLVQEFLNLSCELKNSCYKSCITEYLKINNYPYHNKKIGFQANRGLI